MDALLVPPRVLWTVLRQFGLERRWGHPLRVGVLLTEAHIEALVEQHLLRARGVKQFRRKTPEGFPLLASNAIAHLTGLSRWWLRHQPDFPTRPLSLREWVQVLPPILERHRKGHQAVVALLQLRSEVILRAHEIFTALQTHGERVSAVVEGDAVAGADGGRRHLDLSLRR